MNISGFEFKQETRLQRCLNPYCSSVIPLCFAGINTLCARNRCKSKWYHFSLGEHVCANCYEFFSKETPINRSQSVNCVWRHRMSSWRRDWLKKSSRLGRRRTLSAANFLASNLLPWWLKCNKCGQWRQLPPQTPVGSLKCNYRPDVFVCGDIVKMSNNPCSWPVDQRAKIVIDKPHDFLASMKTHAWLQASPAVEVSSFYGVDLVGLSPDPLPGSAVDDEKPAPSNSPFKVFEEDGVFSPVNLDTWERFAFSEMSRFPTLYLAIRNLVLCLWFHNPKRLLTSRFAADHCFVRGLLRIVLCEHWIPHLIEELTCRGLINIGFCQTNSLNKETGNEQVNGMVSGVSGESIPDQFQLRLIGDSDLTAAVAIRQIWNAFHVRYLRVSGKPVQHSRSTLSVKLISLLKSEYETHNSMNKLTELMLQFAASQNDEQTDEDRLKKHAHSDVDIKPTLDMLEEHCKYSPTLRIPSLSSVQISENRHISSLFVPLHSWSDRIYCYPHHPVSIFAWQTGLELHPVPSCLLLKSNRLLNPASDEKLLCIPSNQSVRIEFHVEAVLDLVTQIYPKRTKPKEQKLNIKIDEDHEKNEQKPVTGESLDSTSSVQACWDDMESEVRKQLIDLSGNPIEQNLTEYFLASVEYDLTEPLTTNSTDSNRFALSNACASQYSQHTARLDRIPVCYFGEATADINQRCFLDLNNENSSAYTSCVLRTPTSMSYSTDREVLQGPINYLFHCLTKEITNCDAEAKTSYKPDEIISITFEGDKICPKLLSDDDIMDVDTLMHITSTRLKSSIYSNGNHIKKEDEESSKKIRLNSVHGFENVDWVIVTTPIDRIRLHFIPNEVVVNNTSHDSKQGYLSIYLPAYLRPILFYESYFIKMEAPFDHHSVKESDDSLNVRLITVTLVYSSSWWRQYLAEYKGNAIPKRKESSDSIDPPNKYGVNELFSFLPYSRETRGFCHNFRDLRPHITSPGILQTEIFAEAADYWWLVDDVLLETAVDRFLRRNLLSPSVGQSQLSEDPQLLCSYVDRLQAPRINVPVGSVCVVNEDNIEQWLRVKHSAWIELTKLTGIFIVNFMKNESYGDYNGENKNGLLVNSTVKNRNRSNCLSACELIYAANPLNYCGMDALTSAVQAGLDLANLTLRLLPQTNHRLTFALFDEIIDDHDNPDTCDDPNGNQSVCTTSHQLDEIKLEEDCKPDISASLLPATRMIVVVRTECLSERTKRLLRRKKESDPTLICLK
ncbi:unnamed protein product [Heterobilharzia americana]|nr:unnamed protein product [Heterobilharzia americana]